MIHWSNHYSVCVQNFFPYIWNSLVRFHTCTSENESLIWRKLCNIQIENLCRQFRYSYSNNRSTYVRWNLHFGPWCRTWWFICIVLYIILRRYIHNFIITFSVKPSIKFATSIWGFISFTVATFIVAWMIHKKILLSYGFIKLNHQTRWIVM